MNPVVDERERRGGDTGGITPCFKIVELV